MATEIKEGCNYIGGGIGELAKAVNSLDLGSEIASAITELGENISG